MSLAQFGASEFSGPSSAGSSASRDNDRVPPQDVHAESSVLGSMMLSKDAIADCVEVVRGVDFYRPSHEIIYDAIIDLYGRGEPADAITVADELTKRGDLVRVGGQSYLHELISAVPTAANASYYAQIVAERAVLRRLVNAGTKIVQLGYGQEGGDVEEIVNAAQAEIYAVADRRGSEDYAVLGDLLEAAADEIDANSGRTGELVGVPTGFVDLDDLTNGLHPGQMIVIAARPAMGKALALDTPLPTPSGWTTMGDVREGDAVLGADGRPIRVVACTEVMEGRPCYEVSFSDGTSIVADEQHQWFTEMAAPAPGCEQPPQAGRNGRAPGKSRRTAGTVRTTGEIARALRGNSAAQGRLYSVPLAKPLELPEADLPVAPYTLGAWLGGGASAAPTLSTVDPEILDSIRAEGYRVEALSTPCEYRLRLPEEVSGEVEDHVPLSSALVPTARAVEMGGGVNELVPTYTDTAHVSVACPICARPCAGERRCAACIEGRGSLRSLLRDLGVLGFTRIPPRYLRSSVSQRRALLAGLLDTRGEVTDEGCLQFTSANARLAEDVYELAVGLGYRCLVKHEEVRGHAGESATLYALTFRTDDPVFRVPRKQVAHANVGQGEFSQPDGRFITAVKPVESVPVRCIQVDADDHLYLAGQSMVPTHNSTLALDIARSASIHHGLTSVVFSLEMSRNEITMRLLSAEAGIQLQHMRKGTMRDEDWVKLTRTMGEVSEAPLFIDDSPNMSLMEIRAKCRRLKQRHNLKLVIIDYLQLMSSGKRVESRQQEVSEFSRALKLLAKEIEVPVVALSQLNRGPEQRTDKKPQVSDLRESGCLTADTRILRADTGTEVTLGSLLESGEKDVPVWALDESCRFVVRPMTHVFPTGRRPVYRLTTASGKSVRATDNHPLLTFGGWKRLGQLAPGDRIAVPRHIPGPEVVDATWADADVVNLAAVATGFLGAGLPPAVFSLPKRQIALFVREYVTRAGGVTLSADRPGGEVFVFADERASLDGLSRLLLRFGVETQLTGDASGWVLDVVDVDSQRRFLQEIGIDGVAAEDADRLLTIVRDVTGVREPGPGQLPLWREVTEVLEAAGSPERAGTEVAPSPLRQVATMLDAGDMDLAAVNDVAWEVIVGIDFDGHEDVFDATVLGAHNFVADGITVHNSIEQDADMVMLLHRESVYEPDSPREGEADIIVAKHRNGPTATITVAFQGHLSRFTNMASTF